MPNSPANRKLGGLASAALVPLTVEIVTLTLTVCTVDVAAIEVGLKLQVMYSVLGSTPPAVVIPVPAINGHVKPVIPTPAGNTKVDVTVFPLVAPEVMLFPVLVARTVTLNACVVCVKLDTGSVPVT
jgi:hypothetical protein